MSYMVTVTAVLKPAPKQHLVDVLADRFGSVEHEHGSTTVIIHEHVAIPDEADAMAFVRSLVVDALPTGSKITAVTAAPH